MDADPNAQDAVFERLEQALLELETAFDELDGEGEAVLSAEERSRVRDQLRALREEVRDMEQALEQMGDEPDESSASHGLGAPG